MTYRYPGGLIRRTAANTAITGASGVWDLGSQAQAVKNNTWPISGLANPVSGSLRFRASASAYLNRTPSVAGNRRTWTWSAWVKRSELSSNQSLFAVNNSGADYQEFRFQDSNTLRLIFDAAANNYAVEVPTVVWRDVSAWYHIVLAVDTTQATSTNRVKIYVNGIQQTVSALSGFSFPAQNFDTYVNATLPHAIGNFNYNNSLYFNGYMTEINFVNAQQLTPSSFGQTSPITGVWEPIKYTGTYGTNGYYLSLSDTSSIGKDFSGNGNNWTPNNFSTANDSTFDLMRDVPTQYTPQGATDVGGVVRGNYCTLNPLSNSYTGTTVLSITDGNLNFSDSTSSNRVAIGSMTSPSGKWYFEMTSSSTGTYAVGLYDKVSNGGSFYRNNGAYSSSFGGGGTSGYSSWGVGDVIGVAWDADAGKLWFAKNNTWQSGSPSSGTSPTNTFTAGLSLFPDIYTDNSSGTKSGAFNFGQRPFTYTPPSGFKSLCTTNLPTPTIGATTTTAANKYFDATLITGTAATQVITNAGGFQPDFVWLKSRTNANNPTIYDAIRGVNTILYPALTNAEQVGTAQLTAFNSNGFTLGASENANDTNGEASVGWQWNAGGSTVTNTAGSINSQVRANPTAGFSIVTWTGTGSNRPSIGHGLGVAPSMIIEKGRDAGTGPYSWTVQHIGLSSWSNSLFLNNTGAENSGSGGGTAPSSTVYYAAANNYAGENGVRYVAYCFAPVDGYSAFGKYTGNGSADGPFVYTGFRPKFIIYKNATSATVGDWRIHDTSRSTFNAAQLEIYAQSADAEPASSNAQTDILSNGFKLRGVSGNTNWNQSGVTYIYAAFAETPFKNSLAR